MVYQDGETFRYKDMGVTTLTENVKNELDNRKASDYVCAMSGVITAKEDEEPDENGYYLKAQLLTPEFDSDPAIFVKKIDTDTFWDYVSDIEITIP